MFRPRRSGRDLTPSTARPYRSLTFVSLPDCPAIHYISNEDRFADGTRYIPGEGWHTDHSNDTRPPKATVLHAVRLPDSGGDTQYANMAVAYAALPAAMRERIAGLDLLACEADQRLGPAGHPLGPGRAVGAPDRAVGRARI